METKIENVHVLDSILASWSKHFKFCGFQSSRFESLWTVQLILLVTYGQSYGDAWSTIRKFKKSPKSDSWTLQIKDINFIRMDFQSRHHIINNQYVSLGSEVNSSILRVDFSLYIKFYYNVKRYPYPSFFNFSYKYPSLVLSLSLPAPYHHNIE